MQLPAQILLHPQWYQPFLQPSHQCLLVRPIQRDVSCTCHCLRTAPGSSCQKEMLRDLSSPPAGFWFTLLQSRFKPSVDSSHNRFPLQILAAELGDAATYYCGARITMEQLCSRVNQKPADGEDRSLSSALWQLLPRALVRQWDCQHGLRSGNWA
uniref:Immunoglobulin V-set domain-containing protein n=1 Tax=Junco hyemalis TaxID=40217 RepID=A0A8C5IYD4_JUNHY